MVELLADLLGGGAKKGAKKGAKRAPKKAAAASVKKGGGQARECGCDQNGGGCSCGNMGGGNMGGGAAKKAAPKKAPAAKKKAPARRRKQVGGDSDCAPTEMDMGKGLVQLGELPIGDTLAVATASDTIANPPGVPSSYEPNTHFTPRFDYMQFPTTTTAAGLYPPFSLPTIAPAAPAVGGGQRRKKKPSAKPPSKPKKAKKAKAAPKKK